MKQFYLILLALAFASSYSYAQTVVASDDFDSPSNMNSRLIMPAPGTMTATGDCFEIYTATTAIADNQNQLVDETLGSNAGDNMGIVLEGAPGSFFGTSDVENTQNPSGTGTVTWVFDISSAPSVDSIAVEMAAMGDFELSNDSYSWEYAIDGGAFSPIFNIAANEAGSHTYTMASGTTFTLSDPLEIGGVVIDNNFNRFVASIGSMTGSTLTLRFTASQNGGNEPYVFDNIQIMSSMPSGVIPTLGEWGMIILALIVLILGTVALMEREEAVA